MNPISVIGLILIYILALGILRREGYLPKTLPRREGHIDMQGLWDTSALAICLPLLAMIARLFLMPHETLDYQDFLAQWVQYFRDNGGFRALSNSVGNYNVPYLYALALFSYMPVDDLILIKLLSIVFDVLLAWSCLRLVRLCTAAPDPLAAIGLGQNKHNKKHNARNKNNKNIKNKNNKKDIKDTEPDSALSEESTAPWPLAAFLIALFLPTVMLNGAYWGQCDSIYAALALWSLDMILERRPLLGVCFMAMSFSVKLQAIFLMPMFLVFLFSGHVKIQHLLAFPVMYAVIVLPAIIAGRPALDTLLLYANQTGSIGDGLNYNSSSLFAILLVPDEDKQRWANYGIVLAGAFLIAVTIYGFHHRSHIDDRELLVLSLLVCIAVPFFLPHMHDRYFFLSDALSLCVALAVPVLWPTAPLVSFASFLGYYAYLNMRYLMPMRYGAYGLIVALALGIWYLTARIIVNLPGNAHKLARHA